MYPARTSSRWLGTSASAGSSRRVRRNRVDIRSSTGRVSQAGGEALPPAGPGRRRASVVRAVAAAVRGRTSRHPACRSSDPCRPRSRPEESSAGPATSRPSRPPDGRRTSPEDDVDAAGAESSPDAAGRRRAAPRRRTAATPPTQATRTSTFCVPFSELHLPRRRSESSTHQPAAGALARTGHPAGAGGEDGAAGGGLLPGGRGAPARRATASVTAVAVAAATAAPARRRTPRRRPGTPRGSPGRRPRRRSAVQAAPRTRVRFMARSIQPNGLRPHQGGVKTPLRIRPDAASAGASVAPWPSSWWSRTTSASARR